MSKLPRLPNLDQAAKTFLVANTPSYLFSHLRRDLTVQWMAQNFSTAELTDTLRYYTAEGAGEDVAPVAVYACLVALSFKPFPEYRHWMESFQAPGVRWLPELKGMLSAGREVTARLNIEVKPPPMRPEAANQTVTTTVPPKLIISSGGDKR